MSEQQKFFLVLKEGKAVALTSTEKEAERTIEIVSAGIAKERYNFIPLALDPLKDIPDDCSLYEVDDVGDGLKFQVNIRISLPDPDHVAWVDETTYLSKHKSTEGKAWGANPAEAHARLIKAQAEKKRAKQQEKADA